MLELGGYVFLGSTALSTQGFSGANNFLLFDLPVNLLNPLPKSPHLIFNPSTPYHIPTLIFNMSAGKTPESTLSCSSLIMLAIIKMDFL
jgi:hypothetical protein